MIVTWISVGTADAWNTVRVGIRARVCCHNMCCHRIVRESLLLVHCNNAGDNPPLYTGPLNSCRLGLPLSVQFFIAIIDKIFKIIAILSVIGDNFVKARNTIAEAIFVLLCVYVSRYTVLFYTPHSSMAAFFLEDGFNDHMKDM